MRVLLLVALVGCMAPSGDQPFEPDAVQTGIYNLTVASSSDSCTPKRFVGDVTVPMYQESGALQIHTADQLGTIVNISAYDVTQATGYVLQIPTGTDRILPCAQNGDDFVEYLFTVTGASADHVEAEETETWTMPTACSNPVTFDAPQTSCAATRTLTYDLLEPCGSGCLISANTCSCP